MRGADNEKKKAYIVVTFTLFFVELVIIGTRVLKLRGWSSVGFATAGVACLGGLLRFFVVPRELLEDNKKPFVVTIFTMFFVGLLFIGRTLDLRGWSVIGFAAGGVAILGSLLLLFVVPQELSEELASRIYMGGPVSGSADGRSLIEAEIQGGHYSTAFALLEQQIAETPANADLRVFAADLYAKAGEPTRAVEILRGVQHMEHLDAITDIVVAHRLVDLLLGPIGEPARALVELRRIVVKYPASNAAKLARTTLTTLKANSASNEGPVS